ncbi:MAG: hypothetical protein ACREM2_11555 [Vulcanimicrobiaceae bacterium]
MRSVHALALSCGLAMLSACGGSGLGSGGGSADFVVFTNGSAQVNDFFLAPSGNAPLLVAATAERGSGQFAQVVPDATFLWAATYAPAGTSYVKGASASASGKCGTPASTPPLVLALQAPSLVYTPLAAGQTANEVFVFPPKTPSGAVVLPAAGSTSYCLTVLATVSPSGPLGSTTVVVSNSP